MKKIIFIIILVVVAIGIFFKFGRAVYVPVKNKIKGKTTTKQTVEQLETPVFNRLTQDLKKVGFENFPSNLCIVGLKEEEQLEIYGKTSEGYRLIKRYPFTAFSGKIGPKLKEGDRQIPEGIYTIEYFNPNSSYYLSIKVSYPNQFDKSKTKFKDIKKMGGDIFIHGKDVTIGCIPIGDEAIEEVFVMAKKAHKNGVKVIISPRDFRKNPTYPKIENITWEKELYDNIKKELQTLN